VKDTKISLTELGTYMAAMRVYDKNWNEILFVWKAKSAEGIEKHRGG
jgi:hypothetical protein